MLINLIISDSHFFIKNELDKIFKSNDYNRIDLNNYKIEDALVDAATISLFDDHKYLLIENADNLFKKDSENDAFMKYLNDPSDVSTIVFVASKVDLTSSAYKLIKSKYSVFTNDLKKSQNVLQLAKDYLKLHKTSMTDKALNYIKDSCLSDYDLMINEINKLIILGKNNISDDLVYNLVCVTPDGNNFRFIDALMEQNMDEALKLVNNMKVLNIDISKMIALISWNVRVAYLVKKYRKDKSKLDDVIKTYNLSNSYSYNNHVRRSNLRTLSEFEDLLIYLADLDISIKNYRIDNSLIGYYLVNKFC